MRITLNLASRPFADVGPAIKRLRIAMAVLAVVAIGLGFGLRALHHKAELARARDHSLDAQISRINYERQSYQDMMRQPDNAQVLRKAVALNKLFDQKAFSWTLAMEDLETVLPGGVQVSTLEPVRDEKTGIITLHLRVIGPRDKDIDLIRNLEHSRRFLLPRITGENAVETTTRPGEALAPVSLANRVNFDILANYNPATPAERKTAKKPSRVLEDDELIHPKPAISTGMSAAHRPLRSQYPGSDQLLPQGIRPLPPPVNTPGPGRPVAPPPPYSPLNPIAGGPK
jgi:type IV pilus assembly protein PilN